MPGLRAVPQAVLEIAEESTATSLTTARMRATMPYEGAGTGYRFDNLSGTNASAAAAVQSGGDRLRCYARDLGRNNVWAGKGIDTFAANAVGTGIRPSSDAPLEEFQERAEANWERFVQQSDATGMHSFYGQQYLSVVSTQEGGEMFARLRPRRREDGLRLPFQVQLLEPEHVPLQDTRRLENGSRIVSGIEFDALGRPVAYWMHREHPGDIGLDFARSGPTSRGEVRVSRDDALHMFKATRIGQVRGVSWLAPIIVRLSDMEESDDAMLVRQKVGNMFGAFIRQPQSDAPPPLAPGGNYANAGSLVYPPSSQERMPATDLIPGMIERLLPGEDIEFPEVPGIGTDTLNFKKYALRGVSSGFRVTYEQLSGDLTDLNFSSIRAGLIEFRRLCEAFIFHQAVFQFCMPIWRRTILEGFLAGYYDDIVSFNEFFQDPEPWYAASWIGHKWEYVNPVDEVNAKLAEIDGGLDSRSHAQRERGHDPEKLDRQNQRDNERYQRFGLNYTPNTRSGAQEEAVGV